MAVISGYHVDEYCVEAFREAVRVLKERFGAQKITDFAAVAPGDLVARVPPKIMSDQSSGALRPVPVYHLQAVGDDFDDQGRLISTGQSDYLYFQADRGYLLDLKAEQPILQEDSDYHPGVIDCFDARDIGRVKEHHQQLEEDLRGILYKLPPEAAGETTGEPR